MQRREIMNYQAREISQRMSQSASHSRQHLERLATQQRVLSDAWSDRQRNPNLVRCRDLKPYKGPFEVPATGPWHIAPYDERAYYADRDARYAYAEQSGIDEKVRRAIAEHEKSCDDLQAQIAEMKQNIAALRPAVPDDYHLDASYQFG